jgi:LacI family transcriptional regulator
MSNPNSATPRKAYRIALLFNANKVYDREIIAGIGAYLHSTRVEWNLFLEDDFRARLSGLTQWQGDGVIADFDDPDLRDALGKFAQPVVAVGGSYANAADYPRRVPYVATDNFDLIKRAHDHLLEAGLPRLALYSLPESPSSRWAQERERAFTRLLGPRDEQSSSIYRGAQTSAGQWNAAIEHLARWITGLQKPVGIIAVTDARARHLMQACTIAGIAVPEQVAIVGIDNDPLAHSLSRIALSSVRQGTHQMGHTAAHMLHQMLNGLKLPEKRVIVPAAGLNAQASSKHIHPYSAPVMKALYYIRQYACQGVKNQQVADYVGVSRSSLESCFRAEVHRTLHQKMLEHRIDEAQRLLRETNLPGTDIALACGFTSIQYMYAVFARELRITPARYRLQVTPP